MSDSVKDPQFDETAVNAQSAMARQAVKWVLELQQCASADMGAALGKLIEHAADSVSGAEYAGITVANHQRFVETAAATHRYPVVLDEIQSRYQQGPCLSAAWEHHCIRIDDLATDDRWPRYRDEAIEQTPIRSIMAFRLFGDSKTVGALNFYAEPAHAFDDDSVERGLIYAAHTALTWKVLRRDEQFNSALASRDFIGQAKGLVMERFRIDAVAAFEVLKRLSNESNTPVAEIAQQLVEADPLPQQEPLPSARVVQSGRTRC